jgi:tight adherence protein C
MLLGAVAGCGLGAVVAGVRGRTESLREAVARYEGGTRRAGRVPGAGADAGSSSARPVLTGVGTRVDRLSKRVGVTLVRLEDLAVLGRDTGTQHAVLGLATVCLAACGAVLATAARSIGIPLPAIGVPGATAGGALAGIALAAGDLRRAARREREAFVRALGCWLELVALAQAGGMGVESALQISSQVSEDPCFLRIRHVLAQARVAASTPWDGLGALGRRIGVRQLEELSSTLALAGTEGARVRTTLTAKAAALRQHQMAAAEAEAKATTERLFLPSIVLMLAFMIFLMYPAAARLSHVF